MPKSDLPIGGDYAPVADRIALFYERFPSGRIMTDLITRDHRDVVFRASVRLQLQGEGLIRGRYAGTLTFGGNVFAATINIDRLGVIEFGTLNAVPRVR